MEPGNNSRALQEIGSIWSTQGIIREWVRHPEFQTYDVIPRLYHTLYTGRSHDIKENIAPLATICRDHDVRVTHAPVNLCAPGNRAYLLAAQFTDEIDRLTRQHLFNGDGWNISQAITDATFVYYTWVRIHPFPDGNGRIGRLLMKRLLQGDGLKDPIFHDSRWYKTGRSEHLEALEWVNETNDLAALEGYVATSLLRAYHPEKDKMTYTALERIIKEKKRKVERNQFESRRLSNIWRGFEGIPMYGN